jgi:phosphoribosylformylglycinamidine cyclo-ligase
MNKPITYADSGVNIELGDDVSKILYNAAKQTWSNRQGRLGELIVPFDDFSGVRAIDVSNLPTGTLMNIGFDGVGTKMELAERINDHRTIAYDLFAMVCDDAVVRGAEPVLIGSILDVNSLGNSNGSYLEQVKQLAEGYINAAKSANVAIVNGEVAELGNRIGGFGQFNYNWGAAVVWFANKDRLFTGREIQEGDYLVGLRETGFRSNGLSLVRKIMNANHGEDWHTQTYNGESLAKLALEPSKVYSGAVVDMFGGFQNEPKAKVHGVAHITGGGIPGKLGRILKPSGLGATISKPYSPAELMLYCQDKGNVPDEEAYKTWNMGQGMIIVTPEPEAVMNVARNHNLESKVIGQVESKPGIRILNSGAYSQNQYLDFK